MVPIVTGLPLQRQHSSRAGPDDQWMQAVCERTWCMGWNGMELRVKILERESRCSVHQTPTPQRSKLTLNWSSWCKTGLETEELKGHDGGVSQCNVCCSQTNSSQQIITWAAVMETSRPRIILLGSKDCVVVDTLKHSGMQSLQLKSVIQAPQFPTWSVAKKPTRKGEQLECTF